MSKALKIAEVIKVNKKRQQGSQKSRSRNETQSSQADRTEQKSVDPARPGALILQTPLFTFVYLPRSHNGGE